MMKPAITVVSGMNLIILSVSVARYAEQYTLAYLLETSNSTSTRRLREVVWKDLAIVPTTGTHTTKHWYAPYQWLVRRLPMFGINSTQISH
ncbi:MAG: hypothetical protein SPI30_00840 [Prevotella sp.]|nr:hypothetical protein [Prevotella sp.]